MNEFTRELSRGIEVFDGLLSQRPLLASLGFGALTALSVWFGINAWEGSMRAHDFAERSKKYAVVLDKYNNAGSYHSFLKDAAIFDSIEIQDKLLGGIEGACVLIEGSMALHFARKISLKRT